MKAGSRREQAILARYYVWFTPDGVMGNVIVEVEGT